jgi:hypothetical protein
MMTNKLGDLMNEYIYVLPPMDWWPGWVTIDAPPVEGYPHPFDQRHTREYMAALKRALPLFREAGWEADIREGPFFAGLPTGDVTGKVIVGLKQDNNGETFICSPYDLQWLDEYLYTTHAAKSSYTGRRNHDQTPSR